MNIMLKDRSEQIEWVLNTKSELATFEQVFPLAQKQIQIDGQESEGTNAILLEIAKQAKISFDYEMTPSIAGYESFVSAIKGGIEKIEDLIRGDRSARKKIILGKEQEVKDAIAEYTSEKFTFKNKEGDGEIQTSFPGGVKTVGELISAIKKANSETKSMLVKYQSDATQFGKVMLSLYKKVDKGGEVSSKEHPSLIDVKPLESLTDSLEDKTKKSPVKIKLLSESEVKAVIMVFKEIGETMAFLNKGLDSLYSYYRAYEDYDDYDDVLSDVSSKMDERIDDISFLSLNYERFITSSAQGLEEALLKSIK